MKFAFKIDSTLKKHTTTRRFKMTTKIYLIFSEISKRSGLSLVDESIVVDKKIVRKILAGKCINKQNKWDGYINPYVHAVRKIDDGQNMSFTWRKKSMKEMLEKLEVGEHTLHGQDPSARLKPCGIIRIK